MKRGLIIPRASFVNPYTSQGLPKVYADLAPNLLRLWDFHEMTGQPIKDLCGSGDEMALRYGNTANGVLDPDYNLAWANGGVGGMYVDGVDQFVGTGTPLLYNMGIDYGSPFSIEAWVLWNDVGPHWIMYQYTRSSTAYYSGLRIGIDTANDWVNIIMVQYLYGATYSGAKWANGVTGTLGLAKGVPYHIVTTYEPNVGTYADFKLYLNGVSKTLSHGGSAAGSPLDGSIWTYTVESYCYGRSGYSTKTASTYFRASTQYKHAIYDKALSEAEAAALYNYERQFMQ